MAVGDGMFGEIVVGDKGVHSVGHEPFGHGGAGKGGKVLVSGVVGCGGADDGGIVESAGVFEGGEGACDVGIFLTDCDVDAVHGAEVGVAAFDALFVEACLVDEGVDDDGGFAGLAVANDEFALSPAYRDHGVDGHDPCL